MSRIVVYVRVCLCVAGLSLRYMCEWYKRAIDGRVMLALRVKRASMRNLSLRLGLSEQHVRDMVKPGKDAGLIRVWYCGRIPCLSLTDKGKQYAEQLTRELGANEVERLLTPKPSKGKRAPIRKLEGKNLADSLGL